MIILEVVPIYPFFPSIFSILSQSKSPMRRCGKANFVSVSALGTDRFGQYLVTNPTYEFKISPKQFEFDNERYFLYFCISIPEVCRSAANHLSSSCLPFALNFMRCSSSNRRWQCKHPMKSVDALPKFGDCNPSTNLINMVIRTTQK